MAKAKDSVINYVIMMLMDFERERVAHCGYLLELDGVLSMSYEMAFNGIYLRADATSICLCNCQCSKQLETSKVCLKVFKDSKMLFKI